MSLYLGVDGGGTKTALCLVSADGTVRGSALVRSPYYLGRGEVALVGEVLAEGVSAVCASAGATPDDIAFAFVGLPSYGEVSADLAALDAMPHAALGHGRYRCDNDMVCGWAGSLGGEDGINVVAGTGSIAYGQWRGTRARAGGWGEVFGDEGSGYWIGIRALQLFSRMSDGRLPAGPLLDVIRDHIPLTTDLDLVGVVFARWRGSRSSIAALAPVVATAARAGDTHATALLADAGTELALLVEATRRKLVPDGGSDDRMTVSFSGGVLNMDEVRTALTEQLHRTGRYELRAPRFPPVIGAALLAARLAGAPLDGAALDRLPATL